MLTILVISGIVFGAYELFMKPDQVEHLAKSMPNPQPVDEPGTTRFLHDQTGCSFALPAGWSILDEHGKSKAFVGPKVQGFIPNIQVDIVAFPGSLDEFADGGNLILKSKFKDFMLIQEENFITNKSLIGVRVIATYTPTNLRLRFYHYYFRKDKDSIIFVTCTGPDEVKDQLAPLFDSCIKSLEIVVQ